LAVPLPDLVQQQGRKKFQEQLIFMYRAATTHGHMVDEHRSGQILSLSNEKISSGNNLFYVQRNDRVKPVYKIMSNISNIP
jgi:hypothetical protein